MFSINKSMEITKHVPSVLYYLNWMKVYYNKKAVGAVKRSGSGGTTSN